MPAKIWKNKAFVVLLFMTFHILQRDHGVEICHSTERLEEKELHIPSV
jgi:hypothetical protein